MVSRSGVLTTLFVACWAVGCSFDAEANFGPLESAGGGGNAASGTAGMPSGGSSATAGNGGAPNAGGGTIGGNVAASIGDTVGGTGLTSSGGNENAVGGTVGSDAGMGNVPSADADVCATVPAWFARSYAIGDSVTSTCAEPYNGLCVASERHEFECRPQTGAVGLGWCRDRQPGVVNGWEEAWLLKARCGS